MSLPPRSFVLIDPEKELTIVPPRLPHAKILNEFIHPGDFFTIRKGTGGGSHGEEPIYVGLFLKACFALSEVPVLQRRGLANADVRAGACGGAGVVVGGFNDGVGGGGGVRGGGDAGASGGDGVVVDEDTGPFCLFRLLLMSDDGVNAPLIPFETYSVCKGMREVFLSNLGMWCRADDVLDIAFVEHVDMVQYGYSIFGGKGVSNSYIMYSHIKYKSNSNQFTIEYSPVNKLWSFCHHHPTFLNNSPSFNHRVLTQLGELRNVVNTLMHTPKAFQGVRKYAQVQIHLETWRYLARKLEKGAGGFERLFVRTKERLVSRRRYLVDMVQDKVRLPAPSEVLLIEDVDDLAAMRSIMGDAFGAGVRKVIKTGSGKIPLCIGDVLNVVCPPTKEQMDNISRVQGKSRKTDEEHALCRRKRDKIVLRYDPIVSKCYITIVFTRLVISDNEDALHVLRSLNHNTMVELLTRQQCVIVQYCCFEFEGGEYFATAVDGNMVSGESRDGRRQINVDASLCTLLDN